MAADLSHALVSRPGCGGPLPSSIDNYRVLTLFDSGLFLQIAKYNLSTSLPVGDGGANDEEGEGGGGDVPQWWTQKPPKVVVVEGQPPTWWRLLTKRVHGLISKTASPPLFLIS
ncbi:hypothetical protein Fot_13382 [Forsythia ovata]|uniref:Uncharacterized protein n=1 Tax=Forsythia ovata TaxID=205694 RepID=A0ABD1W3B2_9LAMI